MGRNRRGMSAACARAGRGCADSSHGSERATPAPRSNARRETKRLIILISSSASTKAKGFAGGQRVDQATNARRLPRGEPLLLSALQMGLVAFRDAPTKTVGEQFSGKALAEMGVSRNRVRKPVQPLEGRTRGAGFRSRECH